MRGFLCGLVVLVVGGGRALGDMGPTWEGELQNAEVVVVGRGVGEGRVEVGEVMKGVESRRFLAVAGAEVGQKVVVLQRYQERRVWSGADIEVGGDPRVEAAGVWRVREGRDEVVELPPVGWEMGEGTRVVTMRELTEGVVKSAPEAAWLEEQVEEALFYPEKAAARAAADPDEGLYVQVVMAVRETRRDAGFLAGYLESKDAVVRVGAQRMLERVTGAAVKGPEGDDEAACVSAAERWRAWWKEHAGKVAWNEAAGRWEERKGGAAEVRKWPAVPADGQVKEEGMAELMAAVGAKGRKPDVAALEVAVRRFVDGGVMRDRVIDKVCGTHREVDKEVAGGALPAWAQELVRATEKPWTGGEPGQTEKGILDWADGMPHALFGGSGPYMPTAPRLRKDVVLDGRIAPALRARLVVENVVARNVERFAAERRGVYEQMREKRLTAEEAERAVFWEPAGGILDEALPVFGALGDEASQRRMLAWYREQPLRFLPAVEQGVEAKHAVVVEGLLAEVKEGRGLAAEWAARTLTLYQVKEGLPLLAGRLGDADPRVREWTAFALTREWSGETTAALMKALEKEEDGKARGMELLALEEAGDVRAEGLLLAAAEKATGYEEVQPLCRGLARIKSRKGLGFIARVALDPPGGGHESQTQWEAVEAFGYITGAYKAYPPARLGSGGGGIEAKTVEAALPVIRAWVEKEKG